MSETVSNDPAAESTDADGSSLMGQALLSLLLGEMSKRVAAAHRDAKKDQQRNPSLEPGVTLRVTLPGDDRTEVGTVSFTRGRRSAVVSDPVAFADWCSEHYPNDIDLVVVPRDYLVKSITDASAASGEPCTPRGETGVPGITVHEGDPGVSTRASAKMTDANWRVVAEHLGIGMPQLPVAE